MKLKPRIGVRLGTKNFIKTPLSDAIASIDYSPKSKLLEIEYKDNNKIYHYLNAKKDIYENILELKKINETLSTPQMKVSAEKYSIGRFVNQEVKPKHDYYELTTILEI